MNWRSKISDDDWALYAASGYGGRSKFGQRPALLVIDVTYGFLGPKGIPALELVSKYPTACGEPGWTALPIIETVVNECRELGFPIFYTGGMTEDTSAHAGRWRDKHPRTLDQEANAHQIVSEIAPRAGDVTIRKSKPSAFFGTPLVSLLIDQGVDTLLVAGCTTSGCVRAAVVDSFSYGFQNFVIEDGVFDRAYAPHAANLFDMDQKYADVRPAVDVLPLLRLAAEPA